MNSKLILEQHLLGPMNNFIYFVGDQKTHKISIIDPGWQAETIIQLIDSKDYHPESILITHSHYDHINEVDQILKKYDIPVYIHQSELEFNSNLSSNYLATQHMDKLFIGNIEIQILHTPGHTPGSQCFLTNNHLISGDTVFIDSCGRCDMPGGNASDMFHSIQKLSKLSNQTIFHPGHHYHHKMKQAPLTEVKQLNPYFKIHEIQSFIKRKIWGDKN